MRRDREERAGKQTQLRVNKSDSECLELFKWGELDMVGRAIGCGASEQASQVLCPN
jgi:hypothetical protein